MKKYRYLFLGGSILVSSPIHAGAFDFLDQEKPNVFSYNYIEGGYLSRDGGFDGFGFAASYDIKPNLSIIGSYSTTSADSSKSQSDTSSVGTVTVTNKSSTDFNVLSIGAAYHYKFENQMLQNTDISLRAEFVNYTNETKTTSTTTFTSDSPFVPDDTNTADAGSADNSESGLRVGVKGRHLLIPKLELSLDVSFDTTDIGFIITPGAVYSFTNKFAVVGTYDIVGDFGALFIGGRMYF